MFAKRCGIHLALRIWAAILPNQYVGFGTERININYVPNVNSIQKNIFFRLSTFEYNLN